MTTKNYAYLNRIGKIMVGLLFGALAFVVVPASKAINSGIGRSVSGGQIAPYQAVVPPEVGFYANVSEIYYPASIGGSKLLPRGRFILANIDADISLTPLTLAYNWKTSNPRVNVLSAVTIPYAHEKISADVQLGGVSAHRTDTVSGLYDIMVRPFQVSYHISQVQHVSLSFDVWMPTGSYDHDDLANLSLDNWTFIPTVAYTQIFHEENIEFSALWALEFYSPNHDIEYQNGTLSRIEALVIKRFSSGFGVGVVGSWMYQLSDDKGASANLFDGFRGRAFGIGPMITWTVKVGKKDLMLNARWVHEFSNKNMMQGDVFGATVSLKF